MIVALNLKIKGKTQAKPDSAMGAINSVIFLSIIIVFIVYILYFELPREQYFANLMCHLANNIL